MAQSDDLPGLIGDVLRIGTIETVDLAAARVTVRVGEIVSQPCAWLEHAGGFRTWVPPTVGEQVMLLCAEGDIAHAVVLRGLYSTSFPAPASDARARMLMPDGTTIDYDPEGHVLTITLADGSLVVDAAQGVTITGDVTITGKLDVSETVTASEDVIGGGKSLKGHRHSGVQAGGAQTGAPV